MSPSPYAPDEPANVINNEVAWLQGAFLGSLLCGVQITLSAMTFLAVLKQRVRRRLRITLLMYIFFLCVVATAGQETSLLFIQIGFIQSRNYPSGPNAYISYQYSSPVSLVSTILFVCASWMIDSLLVWRCKVVCGTGERPWWIGIAVPFVLLIAEYVAGGIFLNRMQQGSYVIPYTLAYSGLSILLNITVTAIISGRLFVHRWRMLKYFGPGHGSHYASVAAILIESALLYTCFVILVIVFFCVGTPASNVLQQVAAQVQCITSLLIIYQIAQGKRWNDEAVVSSADWRRETDTETHVAPEAVHVEIVPDPALDDGMHASQKSETITSSVSAILAPDCAV